MLVLSSHDTANIIIFKEAASKIFKIEDREDIDIITKGVDKRNSEIFELQLHADTNDVYIDVLSTKPVVSPTLAKLISEISKNRLPDTSLPNILAGNMVTKFLRKNYTSLRINLEVIISKNGIVEHLYECKVMCSYDELKRFKPSVSCDTSKRVNQNILKLHSESLVQAVADNFDCNISSINGLKRTHFLAMMMLQTGNENCEEQYKIKRLTTVELIDKDLLDINFIQYKGCTNPAMLKKKNLYDQFYHYQSKAKG